MSSNKKPLILLDVDGVLANFRHTYVEACNRANGTDYTEQDTGHDSWFAQNMGLTQEQGKKTWEELAKPGWVLSMPILPGAKRAVRKLSRMGTVLFVTAPSPTPYWVMERRQWLDAMFSGGHDDPSGSTIFCPGSLKYRIPGDVFIDDRAEDVDRWRFAWPTGLGYTVAPPEPPKWDIILDKVREHLRDR
jgi:5'(3')-deoxyribonucleotidase